jgi:hypothetical protein
LVLVVLDQLLGQQMVLMDQILFLAQLLLLVAVVVVAILMPHTREVLAVLVVEARIKAVGLVVRELRVKEMLVVLVFFLPQITHRAAVAAQVR